MLRSVCFVMPTARRTSLSGRVLQSTARRRSRPSLRRIRQISTSGALCSITSTSSSRRYVLTLIPKVWSSRVTFLSVSAAQVSMPGYIRNSSIWTLRQEHRLMHSPQTDRTGVSLHITGKGWHRTDMHGGRPVWQRCRSISMHSA